MIVREAVRADDAALLRIESASSQGDKLGLAEDRFSFFHRADRFERSIVLVGENERTGALLGVMAASIVRVRIRGEYRTAAYMFDLRNNPDASGGLSKALFVIWKHLERRLKDEGVELLFGYVKKDNSRSLSIVQRMGATSRGMVSHFTIPVLPPGPCEAPPTSLAASPPPTTAPTWPSASTTTTCGPTSTTATSYSRCTTAVCAP